MLKIRRVKGYTIAKYPQGAYYRKPTDFGDKWLKGGLTSTLFLFTSLASAEPLGVTGPPPIPADMVTENEARAVIEKVFARNKVNLKPDAPCPLNSKVDLKLDGYDPVKKIGYEYLTEKNLYELGSEMLKEIESRNKGLGPYIEIINAMPKGYKGEPDYDSRYQENLEKITQEFIDSLKARGII